MYKTREIMEWIGIAFAVGGFAIIERLTQLSRGKLYSLFVEYLVSVSLKGDKLLDDTSISLAQRASIRHLNLVIEQTRYKPDFTPKGFWSLWNLVNGTPGELTDTVAVYRNYTPSVPDEWSHMLRTMSRGVVMGHLVLIPGIGMLVYLVLRVLLWLSYHGIHVPLVCEYTIIYYSEEFKELCAFLVEISRIFEGIKEAEDIYSDANEQAIQKSLEKLIKHHPER